MKFDRLKSALLVSGAMALGGLGLGCNGAGAAEAPKASEPTAAATPASPAAPQGQQTPAPEGSSARKYTTDALVFDGAGAAAADADILEQIAREHGLTVDRVNSQQLNSMSLDEISKYGVIIWPGGYAGQMTNSLDPETRERVRLAVTERGVSYMGICAGAFMAISPAPADGKGPKWGLSLIPGEVMDYYYPRGDENSEIEMVDVTLPGGAVRNMLWYGGPLIPALSGGVTGKFPDGSGAMAQAWAGKGFVTLSSVHPEEPEIWMSQNGLTDKDGADHDIAWQLIQAALFQKPMKTL